jgi:AbrB family looped-hinge helix DNA binding protein
MSELATTRLSSKGQIVIPEDVRIRLGLKPGVQFVVMGEGDVVILKIISPPSMKEFDELIVKARRQARRAGLKRKDIAAAIREVRAKK